MQDVSVDVRGTQLILASATMPSNRAAMLETIIDPSTLHEVVSPQLHKILPHVEQNFMRMTKTERPVQLLRLVKQAIERHQPCIVFANKSATSDYISMFLNENNVECVNLNGDMHAMIRIGQFEKFQSGAVSVLSTTDITSRGLDTTRVNLDVAHVHFYIFDFSFVWQARHIVNFDFPLHMADYIHRIGRTGRMGSDEKCWVTNFVSSLREIELVQRIEHSVRTVDALPHVNANITNIIKNRIIKEMNVEAKNLQQQH